MNRGAKKVNEDDKRRQLSVVERRASKTTNLAALTKKPLAHDVFIEDTTYNVEHLRRQSTKELLSTETAPSYDGAEHLTTNDSATDSKAVKEKLGDQLKYDRSKYFGDSARDLFFDRFKWMSRVKSDLTDECNLMENTMFDSSINKISEFPFSVRRPDIEDHHDEFEDYDCIHDEVSGGMSGIDGDLASTFNYRLPEADNKFIHQKTGIFFENSDSLHGESTDFDVSMAVSGPFSQFSSITPTSPRSKYIVGCLRDKLNPRASLILRKRINSELKLEHLGMGDKMGIVFAEALREMSYVHSINLDDNNLTDVSLSAIITSICSMKSLTYLNLSRNVVDGDAALALANFLKVSDSPLKRLICHKSDIDDFECHLFVAALECNTMLEELDLGANLIGRAENLNTVMPELITGGEALAALIASNSCHISMLHLSWNMIRLDGAIELASSLSHNKYLRYLDLSYNSLGATGGEMLGMALLSNQCLRTLLISNNNINSTACFTICVGIEENFSLEYVNMDGNPIGVMGAKILMQIPVTSGSRVRVSAAKCNITLKENAETQRMFDFDNIPNKYTLDMSNHFQRAVCVKLLYLVATSKTLAFRDFQYTPPPAPGNQKSPPSEKLHLVESVVKTGELLDPKKQRVVHNLQKIQTAAEDIQTAQKLFNQYDTDLSGGLDLEELQQLLKSIEMDLDTSVLKEALANYDVDGQCVLGLPEFLDFLRGQKEEATSRIKELTEMSIMSLKSSPGVAYSPPKEGIIDIYIVDGYMRKNKVKVISGVDQSHIMDVAKDEPENKVNMLVYSLLNSKLRLREAWEMYEIIFGELRDKAKTLEKLLPHMYDAKDARTLMFKALEDDKVELARVKKLVGYALKPILGMPDGYYLLDLSKEKDRVCLALLLEQNEFKRTQYIEESLDGLGEVGDLSQRGDWSSFRNSFLNGQSMSLIKEMFTPMPYRGIVSFDFSGSDKPPKNPLTVSDARIMNVLFNLALIDKVEKIQGLKSLRKMDEECSAIMMGDEPYRSVNTQKRANGIRACEYKFYTRLNLREKQLKQSIKQEGLKMDFGRTKTAPIDSDEDEESVKRQASHEPLLEADDLSESDSSVGSMNSLGDIVDTHSHLQSSDSESDSDGSEVDSGHSNKEADTPVVSATDVITKRPALLARAANKTIVPTSGRLEFTASQGKEGRSGSRARVLSKTNAVKGMKQIEVPTKEASTDLEPSERTTVNPKVLQSMKSSFTMDDSTGKIKRKLGAIVPTHSEKYILEFGDKFRALTEQRGINDSAKSVRIVTALEDILGRVWIMSRQLAIVVYYFSIGVAPKTKFFGTYRVELVISLFSRIVDVHNFDLVLRQLTPLEVACVTCRLGLLNFYNPMKPEGYISLDLSLREERVVAKIIAALSVVEPGENFQNPTFRWEWELEDVPGWTLINTWMTEEGMAKRGIMLVEYYSGEGQGLKGCSPNIAFRRALLNFVRLKEEDIIADSACMAKHTMGAACARAHENLFKTFLAPPNSTSAQIASGTPIDIIFPLGTGGGLMRRRLNDKDDMSEADEGPKKKKSSNKKKVQSRK